MSTGIVLLEAPLIAQDEVLGIGVTALGQILTRDNHSGRMSVAAEVYEPKRSNDANEIRVRVPITQAWITSGRTTGWGDWIVVAALTEDRRVFLTHVGSPHRDCFPAVSGNQRVLRIEVRNLAPVAHLEDGTTLQLLRREWDTVWITEAKRA